MKMKKALLELVNRKTINEYNDARFVALTPTDNADSVEHYINALTYALYNDCIKNIALTGPYGSGKTSIIWTFEKRNSNIKFLNISLASFKEDSGDDDSASVSQNIMIERSILQQMLYGDDANKLPYSRFKRISTPDKPQIKSLLVVFWIVASIFLYLNRGIFLSMEVFNDVFLTPILLISYVIGIPVVLISDIYKSSFGMSLKKISFKNAEIETGDVPETSILNRHLDEIIYFFQETEYDVVVIEDLDRFGSPDIFVKLREINKLVNDNEKTSGKIKFLYALKDDMFAHKNRAKFFDFIIPVVPIINSSNSLDKMLERLKDEPFAEKIDKQFLREVSLYIDDLRIIHNIFNEFIVYNAKLNSDSLNLTKLLAMMIYKNVYPGDFENLHHGKGALYEVSRLRTNLLAAARKKIYEDISSIQEEISDSKNEAAENVDELINIFLGHIVSSVGQPVYGIYLNNSLMTFTQLKQWESFESLFQISNIIIAVPQSYYQNQYQQLAIGKSFSQLESEVSPKHSFAERKKNIVNKEAARRVELQAKINLLEKEKSALSQMTLHELLQKNDVSVDEICKRNAIDDFNLIVYLIKNGHLDENYHLYTSNFHEGRLSKNDRDYLLAIRDFKKPDPKQVIDTPSEVCKNMRSEDFCHKYVLNVALVDFLLADKVKYQVQLNSTVDYISSDFAGTEEFFTAYWETGKNVKELVKTISEKWPGYAAASVKSAQASNHIALILNFVNPNYIADKMNLKNTITSYISEQAHLVYASDVSAPEDFTVLKNLNVKFCDLSSIENNKILLDFAYKESLYAITPSNIGLLLDLFSTFHGSAHPDHMTANYSAICSSGCEALKKYVDVNLSQYIDAVFLALSDNIKESSDIVKDLINSDTIGTEQKQQIISKQVMIFENFDNIPTDLWSYILSKEKVNISWQNISIYLKQEECENEIVTELLNRQNIVDILSEKTIKIDELGDVDSKLLSSYVIKNDEIKDAGYLKLIKCLPYIYSDFPKAISQVKTHLLANAGRIQLTEESFNSANSDEQLLSLLICSKIDKYLANKQTFPITDTVREKLLSFEIGVPQKIEICKDVAPASVKASNQLSRLIADVMIRPDVNCSLFDNEVTFYAIVNARSTEDSIQILTKCITTWDLKMTMDVLEKLPTPFSEIAEYGRRPKLPNTSTNRQFVRLLETRKMISSATEKDDYIKINTFKPSD